MKHTHVIVALGAFVALTGAACGAQTPLGAPLVAGPSTTGAAGTTAANQTGALTCGPTGDRYQPTSIAALKAALQGTWALCSPVGLFRRTQDGVFIGPDDRYVFLTFVGGAYVQQKGLENKGHLEYVGSFQVNFVSDSGGTIISLPVLSDVPRQLLINNNGVEEYTYGRVGAVGPNDAGSTSASVPAPGDIRQPTEAMSCAGGEAFKPTDLEAVRGALHGTWSLCSNLGLFRRPQAGIYIGPDDRWVFLGRDNGNLVALPGLENKGQLEYVNGGSQVNFKNDSGATIIAAPPLFTDVPRLLSIINNGVDEYTYSLVR